MTKYICDRCGKEYKSPKDRVYWEHVKLVWVPKKEGERHSGYWKEGMIDLCDSCFNRLKFLRGLIDVAFLESEDDTDMMTSMSVYERMASERIDRKSITRLLEEKSRK